MEKQGSNKTVILAALLLVILFAAGAFFRYYAINWGLPAELNVDETHFVPRAIKFGTGDLNPHFFFYPSLYMYMLFVSYAVYFVAGYVTGVFGSATDFAIQYFIDPSPFYIIGRCLTATLNLLTAVLVYRIAARFFNRNTALVATAAFLFSPLCAVHSHYVTSDVPLTFFLTLDMYLGLRMMESGRRKFYLAAGFVLGLSMATKYTSVLFAPVLVLMHFMGTANKPGSSWKDWILKGDLYFMGIVAYAGFFLGCPYHLLDFKTFSVQLLNTIETTSGYWLGLENVQNMWLRIITDYLANGVGIPVLVLAAAGMILSLATRHRYGIVLSATILFFYVMLGRYRNFSFDRYWIPIIPALAILCGYFISFAAGAVFKKGGSFYASAFVAVSIALLNTPALTASVRQFSLPYTQNIAAEWIEKNIPEGTSIAIELNGPQLTGSLQSHLDAQTVQYEPGDMNPEAEKFNRLNARGSGKPREPSQKKYLSLALENMHPQYYLSGAFSLAAHPIEFYRKKGVEYLIANSSMEDRYLAAPEVYPVSVKFYKSLDTEAQLVKTFRPQPGKSTGPTIWIYKL